MSSRTLNQRVFSDLWLFAALLVTAALYGFLAFLQPSGEGWGRGWNMIGFLIYSAPTALVAAGVAAWRVGRSAGQARRVAGVVTAAALFFPIVCIVAIRLKA